MHRAACVGRENAAIDQGQDCVELLREKGRSTAVISERRHRRQRVLVPALSSEGGLHPPDRQDWPERHAETLLDGRTEGRIGLLEGAPACDDERAAPLGEELIERQTEAALPPVSRDGCGRISRRHKCCEGCGADAPCPCFLGELLLPDPEPSRGAAARRRAGCIVY